MSSGVDGERETFPETVSRQLAFLADDYGFRTVSEGEHLVRLESADVGVEALFDPRGEVEVTAFRLGHEEPFEKWSYTGMVGRASVSRLLEIAAERLRAEESVLRGDPDVFERLTNENRREAEEWTDYYAGRGPRPRSGKLP